MHTKNQPSDSQTNTQTNTHPKALRKVKPKVIQRLLAYTKPHLPWLAASVLVSLAGAALTILTSRFLGKLSDQAVAMDLSGFMRAIVPMIVVLVIQMPINYLKTYCTGRYGEYSLYDIRKKTTSHIQQLPVSYMDKHPSGDLMSRLTNDVNLIAGFLQGSLSELISEPLTFLASVIFLFVISFKLSLFSFAVIPVFIVLAMVMSKPAEKYVKQQEEALAEVNALSQDMISGMAEAKSFRLEEPIAGKFGTSVDQSVKKGQKAVWVNACIGPVNTLMQLIPFILLFTYGGYLVIGGEMSFGELIAFVNLTNSVVNPLNTLPRVIGAYRSASAAGSRVLEIWDESAEPTGKVFGPVKAAHHTDAIRFDDIRFSYDDTLPFIDGLRFAIAPGETYALVGPSGCGKSTVLKLIAGFYRAQSGSIRIFGRPLGDWDIQELRDQIAWVSQDTYLFPVSILENIAYGKQGASAEEVRYAAQSAGIHDYIMSLPEQYNTQIGERGVKLSGGQRQRLSIARAVLKDAPILLLDEATSALDAESEHTVQAALNGLMKGRTSLVVAHRLSTIKSASTILVMDQGTIVEQGTHEELLENGPLYKRLYYKQMAAESASVPGETSEAAVPNRKELGAC